MQQIPSPDLMHDIEFAKKPVVESASLVETPHQLQQMQVDVSVKDTGCSILSPDEAALTHTNIDTQDIVLFALVGVYIVVAGTRPWAAL